MKNSGQYNSCQGCGKPLTKIVIEMQKRPDASQWCKEGYHSAGCFKNYFSKKSEIPENSGKETSKTERKFVNNSIGENSNNESYTNTSGITKKYPSNLILDAKILSIISFLVNLFFMIITLEEILYSVFFSFTSILYGIIIKNLFQNKIELGTTLMLIAGLLYLPFAFFGAISGIVILYSPIGIFGIILAILIKRRI